jgi:maleylpyruvate isomerase
MALALEPLCPADSQLPPETHPDTLPSLDLAASLPARALRHLFEHSAIHLDVCWRDLPGPAWEASVDLAGQGMVPVRDLPRLRAVNLWRHALALGSGASLRDAPPVLREFLGDTDMDRTRERISPPYGKGCMPKTQSPQPDRRMRPGGGC